MRQARQEGDIARSRVGEDVGHAVSPSQCKDNSFIFMVKSHDVRCKGGEGMRAGIGE